MKHLLKYIIALVGLLTMGLSGCTRDILLDEENSAELSLSQKEVVLNNSNREIDINVTTKGSWNCITSSDWLECTKSENKIHLKAKVNHTEYERVATVIVTMGLVTEQVLVKQTTSTDNPNGSIYTSKTEFQVDQWGSRFVIPVYTNSKNWVVLSSDDWVTARSNIVKGEIQVTVAETEERPDRSASILVRDVNTGDNFAVKITQKGIMFIILPYLEFGTSIDPLIDFEVARKSTVVGIPGDNSGAYGAINKDMCKFVTKSKLFTRMEYRFVDDKMTQAYAYSNLYQLESVYDEFVDFLIEHGFVPDEGSGRFFNKKMEMMAELKLSYNSEDVHILYTYLPNQKEAFPTFEELPGRLSNVPGWVDYDKDKIYDWETANGGVTTKKDGVVSTFSKTRTIYYTSTEPLAPEKSTYTLKASADDQGREKITGLSLKFRASDTNKFFWEKDGIYYLTDEFMQLCTKSKMKYLGKSGEGHIFNNPETGNSYNIKVVMESGKASVTMSVTP